MKTLTKKELILLFEKLVEMEAPIVTHPKFRQLLSRNANLYTNQVVREANGNIAYRTVDFQLTDEVSDQDFWNRIDQTPYNDLIEDNAAIALMKMAEKLKLV